MNSIYSAFNLYNMVLMSRVLLFLLVAQSFCRISFEVSVSQHSFMFIKWVKFVPVINVDGYGTAITDEYRNKYYFVSEYFNNLAIKSFAIECTYKVNDDLEYKNQPLTLKGLYEDDLVYVNDVELSEICGQDGIITIVNDSVEKTNEGFRISLSIKCKTETVLAKEKQPVSDVEGGHKQVKGVELKDEPLPEKKEIMV